VLTDMAEPVDVERLRREVLGGERVRERPRLSVSRGSAERGRFGGGDRERDETGDRAGDRERESLRAERDAARPRRAGGEAERRASSEARGMCGGGEREKRLEGGAGEPERRYRGRTGGEREREGERES
jgi:hypothetical protein